MDSILNLSKRTLTKIMKRLGVKCSNCGWNLAVCDVHHITPKSKGGSDSHDNLSYLCPNCHRLAHNNKIISFINLTDYIGDTWKDVYYPHKSSIKVYTEKTKNAFRNNLKKGREIRKQQYEHISMDRINLIKNSIIDYTQYGWKTKVAKIIGISPQKVSMWMKKHMPEIYKDFDVYDRVSK